MPDEVDWEEYARHVETALERARVRANKAGDECHNKWIKSHNKFDQGQAEIAYWLRDMIDDLRAEMKIGPGYQTMPRSGTTYWKQTAYIGWQKNDAYNVDLRRAQERIRQLEDQLDIALHQ
jgi:hypothetical protein